MSKDSWEKKIAKMKPYDYELKHAFPFELKGK